jgi:DNA-binding XRE family transcriptional regulator
MAISLASARVNAELTQAQVCEALKIGRNTLVNYEAYKTSPDMERAKQLAELYGLEVTDIRWTKE